MIDGYTETGSSANLTLGRRTVQDIEERFDLTLRQTIALANAHALTAEARLGALAFQRIGPDTISAVLFGQEFSFLTPGRRDVTGGTAIFSAGWQTPRGLSLFVSGEGVVMDNQSRVVIGTLGVRQAF